MPCVRTRLALALLGLAPIGLLHAVEVALPGVLVTAAALDEPAVMTADARAPRQPVPAHDGADILKTFPGFNVTRKGGADGDVVFRGWPDRALASWSTGKPFSAAAMPAWMRRPLTSIRSFTRP